MLLPVIIKNPDAQMEIAILETTTARPFLPRVYYFRNQCDVFIEVLRFEFGCRREKEKIEAVYRSILAKQRAEKAAKEQTDNAEA